MENKREEIIRQKILEEDKREMIQLSGIRMKVWQFLTGEKGYSAEEIFVDPEFELILSDCTVKVSIDFLIKVSGTDLLIIRCSPTSIESWERYIIAFARVAGPYQIPFGVVTDGIKARIFDTINGRLIGEKIEEIPSREELLRFSRDFSRRSFPTVTSPLSSERLEREKRIVYAFEGVKCTVTTPSGSSEHTSE